MVLAEATIRMWKKNILHKRYIGEAYEIIQVRPYDTFLIPITAGCISATSVDPGEADAWVPKRIMNPEPANESRDHIIQDRISHT